jgi:hypothetical protein
MPQTNQPSTRSSFRVPDRPTDRRARTRRYMLVDAERATSLLERRLALRAPAGGAVGRTDGR